MPSPIKLHLRVAPPTPNTDAFCSFCPGTYSPGPPPEIYKFYKFFEMVFTPKVCNQGLEALVLAKKTWLPSKLA